MLDFVNKPINPPGPYKFNVITTFAGVGGSSIGYKWAGGKVLVAVEWDENAVITYRLNHKNTSMLHRDIATVSVDEMLNIAGLKSGELDIFDGSPPCQGFSVNGKRQFDDPRNGLFREYVRLLRGLQPKVFVMENVSGMVKGQMKHIFAIAMRELKASGYQVRCQLLNAMYFGVPQRRERVIFIGVRNDLGVAPSYPLAHTRLFTVREALEGLPGNVPDASIGHCWIDAKPESKSYQALLRTKEGQPLNGIKGYANARRLAFDEVSCTIQTGGLLPGYPGSSWPCHPTFHRGISAREAARLASFPDTFNFGENWRDGCKRIGNSVPPLLMKVIAGHIYTHILSKIPPQATLLERVEEGAHV